MNVGAHVSIAGGIHNAVERQLDVGGNCGQIFTHSPRVWGDPTVDADIATAFADSTQEAKVGPWVIHACYLVNLATPKDDLREKSINNLQDELDAAAELAIPYVNVHLGAHTGAGEDGGLANAIEAINELRVPDSVTLVLETDAGSGTKLGDAFEHLATVKEEASHDIAICLDTAHTFAAGYDLADPDAVDASIAEFDSVIGLDSLVCIHLNDSKHACGTNKDEHEHIGEGEIGTEGMEAILTHDALRDLPFVLETPTDDERDFAWNISRARELAGH